MAIASTTITINAGWTRGNLITQWEQALSFAELHSDTTTGLVIGVGYTSATSIGGTVGTTNTTYRDIFPITNTGIGTGASFNVTRNNGVVSTILMNRPGVGYSGGDIITISGNDIGGISNGAENIVIPVVIDSNATGINTYNFSYTGQYVLSGTDINGSVSNVGMSSSHTITIREGDTLNITCSNSSTNFSVFVVYEDGKYSGQSLAVNTVLQGQSTTGTLTWRSSQGQAGTYYITSSASQTYNVAHNIQILANDGSRTFSPVGYGSTSTFYDKSLSNPHPWGVFKQTVQSGKRYGETFRGIQIISDSAIGFVVGSSFQPTVTYPNISATRFKGSQNLDLAEHLDTATQVSLSSSSLTATALSAGAGAFAHIPSNIFGPIIDANAGNSFSLELIVYRSGIDPKFSIFSYKQPNLSSTAISGNNKQAFFFHNFTTNIWDLDDVFLSGITQIIPSASPSTSPQLIFRTYCAGGCDWSVSASRGPSWRAAECGYTITDVNQGLTRVSNIGQRSFVYQTNAYPSIPDANLASSIYYRTNDATESLKNRGIGMSDSANFNAIISGIPLNGNLVPVPYYLPDDFVIIQFENATPSLNVQQGDTIVVQEGVEEYTIITGSYNQTTKTRGILFCARKI